MTYKLMTNPATGQVGLFVENGTTGTWDDPNASRNAPLITPASFLDKIKFHSDLDFLEVAFAGSGNITHASIAGTGIPAKFSTAYGTNAGSDDNIVLTHSLGYEPFALVAVGSNILWPGMPVQIAGAADGGARYAVAYVNTTQLGIYTQATIGGTSLASATLTYSWLVFKNPPAAAGNVMFDFDPATGIVKMGFGKFHSDAPYLQVVSGGSPFNFSQGRTIDLNNGAPKAWLPDGTTKTFVPSALSGSLPHLTYAGVDLGGSSFGSSMGYGGSYTGPSSVLVQAP